MERAWVNIFQVQIPEEIRFGLFPVLFLFVCFFVIRSFAIRLASSILTVQHWGKWGEEASAVDKLILYDFQIDRKLLILILFCCCCCSIEEKPSIERRRYVYRGAIAFFFSLFGARAFEQNQLTVEWSWIGMEVITKGTSGFWRQKRTESNNKTCSNQVVSSYFARFCCCFAETSANIYVYYV